ncbi:hypothetical protein PoB_006457600 [Plakobranchus ocellatus]|uniref:Uncharacterized protein n=1 Tax=Plakobranchus ocellatus TaxID=259542 RepID=A0AAV4D240_9GAST|nr:hypothetical protein PoB_006457600 [Plakobranchus ocellatus]
MNLAKEKENWLKFRQQLDIARKILGRVRKRKLSFLGHACRSKSSLMKDVMKGTTRQKRQGKIKTSYFENTKDWTGKKGAEIFTTMERRKDWRDMTKGIERATSVS